MSSIILAMICTSSTS